MSDSIRQLSQTTEIQRIIYNNQLEMQQAEFKADYRQRTTIWWGAAILIFTVIVFTLSSIGYKRKNEILKRENELGKMKSIISTLSLQIKETEDRLQQSSENELQLQSTLNNNLQALLREEEKLFNQQLVDFKKSRNYRLIEKANKAKDIDTLRPDEQEELKKEILSAFPDFVNWIRVVCPPLKEDDIFLCILIKAGVVYRKVYPLMGYFDSNPIRQRKSRIKKEMIKYPNGNVYFESIFGTID